MSRWERRTRLTRLRQQLMHDDSLNEWANLLNTNRYHWKQSGLSAEEYASAIAGVDMHAPDGRHCSHLPEEYAANAFRCPDSNERGECNACPF